MNGVKQLFFNYQTILSILVVVAGRCPVCQRTQPLCPVCHWTGHWPSTSWAASSPSSWQLVSGKFINKLGTWKKVFNKGFNYLSNLEWNSGPIFRILIDQNGSSTLSIHSNRIGWRIGRIGQQFCPARIQKISNKMVLKFWNKLWYPKWFVFLAFQISVQRPNSVQKATKS